MTTTAAAVAAPVSKGCGVWAAFAALSVVCLLPTPQGLPVAGHYMLVLLLGATWWPWLGCV